MIMLGNLSAKQMAFRLGFELTDEDEKELESFRCEQADVKFGQWHCFDIPFVCVAGGMRSAEAVWEVLKKYQGKITYGGFEIALGIDDRQGVVRNEVAI